MYAESGAKVIVSDIQDELGKKVAEAICKAGGRATYAHADVSKPEDCAAGLRINTVEPAFIRTPMVGSLDAQVLDTQIAPMHAIGCLGEPREVAELVLWLSSDHASFATEGYLSDRRRLLG